MPYENKGLMKPFAAKTPVSRPDSLHYHFRHDLILRYGRSRWRWSQ